MTGNRQVGFAASEAAPEPARTLVLDASAAGRRLDVVLAESIEGESRTQLARHISEGAVTLNGKPYDKLWFNHSAVVKGGTLVFTMGAQPNTSFGAGEGAVPPSMSK